MTSQSGSEIVYSGRMQPKQLFVYGSLCFPTIQQALFEREIKTIDYVVDGWVCQRLRDRPFPGLVRQSNTSTVGMLLLDVSLLEWRLIDAFEGPLYSLVPLGPPLTETSTFALGDIGLATDEVWLPSAFASSGLESYRERVRDWRQEFALAAARGPDNARP